jgi:hypothetical protein
MRQRLPLGLGVVLLGAAGCVSQGVAPMTTEGTVDHTTMSAASTTTTTAATVDTWERPACPAGGGTDGMPSVSAIAWPAAWAEYDATALMRRAAQTVEDVEAGWIEPIGVETEPNPYYPLGGWVDIGPLDPLATLKGTPPQSLGMRYDEAILLADAANALNVATVLLGFEPPDVPAVLPQSVAAIALILPDGQVTFIQVCTDHLQGEFASFAAGQTRLAGATPADLLRGLAAQEPEVLAAYTDWTLHDG